MPSDDALQDVCDLITSAFNFLVFSPDDIRRLRGFAMACSHELARSLAAAQQAAVTSVTALATALVPVPTTPPSDHLMDVEGIKDRRVASVVARQWRAYCIGHCEPTLRARAE